MKAGVGTRWAVRYESEVGASSVQDHEIAVDSVRWFWLLRIGGPVRLVPQVPVAPEIA
jgi:hypothetical protein